MGLLQVIPLSLSARGQTWLRFIALQIDSHQRSVAPQSMSGEGNAAAAARVLSASSAGLCAPGSCRGWIRESGGTALPLRVSPVSSPGTGGSARPGGWRVPKASVAAGPCCGDGR